MKYRKLLSLTMLLAVSITATADLTTGLVAYYPFNGNTNDESGNENNGTVYGATLTTDMFGNPNGAYSFNGTNSYILIGDPVPSILQIQNEITLSAWIYASSYGSDLGMIVGSQCDRCGGVGATIFLDPRTSPDGLSSPPGHIHFQIGNGSWHHSNSQTQVSLNKWVHIVATRKANEDAKIYYDGVLQPVIGLPWSGNISYNDTQFAIGQQKDLGRYFSGSIDDVRIYNRALSHEEIQQLSQEGTNKSLTISSFIATPKAGNPPLTVNFVVTANDSDGSIVSYQWDFDGDGITDDTTTTGETAHTYYDLGIFNANVSIIDNQNGTIKSNSIPINVQYGPDLIGKIVSYNFNDTTNTINIAFKVSNMGGVPANQFPVTFNLSNDGTTVLSNFKEITVGTLGIRKSKIIKFSYSFTGSIYDKYILIFIDPKKNIAEVDESNNGSRIVVQSMPTQ